MLDKNYQRILVIRLGALGDLVLCAPAFQAIRAAHPRAIITLLTQPAWEDFTRAMPWFDQVLTDTRPSSWQWEAWAALLSRIKRADPQLVVDLQGKRRQNILYTLLGGMWGGVDWSGAAWRCAYPRVWPPQLGWHFRDFVAAQLQAMQIPLPAQHDFSWLDAPLTGLELPEAYALLIPGSSPSRPEKRWPHFAALAQRLLEEGLTPVMIGAKAEASVLLAHKNSVPGVIDLGGKTDLLQIGAIARRARVVIGNDTGPTHIAAAVGAPTLALFAGGVNPVWSAPQGNLVQWLQETDLDNLRPARVYDAVAALQAEKAKVAA